MKLFHVSAIDHPIGTILKPGRFGAGVRGPKIHQTPVDVNFSLRVLSWESTLEVARRLSAPNSPSRLDCLFAMPSLAEAKQFQSRYRQGVICYVFEIEVADDTPMHTADFESISTLPAGKSFVDGYVDASLAYWTAADNSSLREILIGGDANVVAKH
jgi:hypothetical protein